MSYEITPLTKQNALEVFTAEHGLDPFLSQIRKEIDVFVPDTGTTKGRASIASIAAKVAKSKTYLDGVGKELVDRLKEQPKLVDAERKRMRDLLDKWKEEVRQPLTDWENAEKERVSQIQERIANLSLIPDDANSKQLSARIKKLDDLVIDESFAEFQGDAALKKESMLLQLKLLLKTVEQKEREQAELDNLRKQQAEREQQEREQRLIKDAEERATKEVEKKARELIELAHRKEIEARIKLENAEHEKRAYEERERVLIERQADEIESAKKGEAQRIAQEAEKQRKERRLAQETEKVRFQNETIDETILFIRKSISIEEEDAKTLVDAIIAGDIPNLSINLSINF